MKKNLLLLAAMALLAVAAHAIPADPKPVTVTQPDGSSLTLVLHGDEFFHFTTTLDGYTVMKDSRGCYTYARLEGGRLAPSAAVAHDAGNRTAADFAMLAVIPKGLTDAAMATAGSQRLNNRRAAQRRVGADGHFDYGNFRGLIILINYTDKKFSMTDAGAFYDDMVNTHDFTGYTLNGRRVGMTGSVRDYYYDNSNHIFDPSFDVVGPVDVPYSCKYPNSTDNAEPIFNAALAQLDEEIDFSDYDTDGDGEVDMVFFLVAGFSANYSGNNEAYLWPHMYYLYGTPRHDGVSFGLYACSTEIAGWENYYSDVNGIGTICHEFSHVLGLPDLYDTDYSGSGGESNNPGDWDIMAGGSGSNFGRNPVGYSLYERYALGFSTPKLIDGEGSYSMSAIDTSNEGYRLNTPVKDQFFLLENRQAGKWDKNLPGHGMLVARVDSTNEMVWWQNTINCNPAHMYYDLLRAGNGTGANANDPFPGTDNVTSLTNFTKPSLMTWDKQFNEYAIFNIKEGRGGVISFDITPETSILNQVEDFEAMPVTGNTSAKGVRGVYSKWDFTKCAVAEYEGGQAVAMKSPSQIVTSKPLNIIPYIATFKVTNPTTKAANIRFYYSVDTAKTWTEVPESLVSVQPGESATGTASLPVDKPVMLRFAQTAGHNKQNCYLDDIKLLYQNTWGPDLMPGDVNADNEVNIADVNAVIDLILNDASDLETADVNGDGEVNIADVNAIIDMILGAM